MSETGRTIKQLADELGVSKTAVRKYMTEEFRTEHTANRGGNIIVIDSAGCKLIAESFRKPPETSANQFPETSENQGLRDEIAFLREQLGIKDQQIAAKDRQIDALTEQNSQLTSALEHTTESLHAAQALHAGTMQKQLSAGAEGQPESEKKGVLRRILDALRGE